MKIVFTAVRKFLFFCVLLGLWGLFALDVRAGNSVAENQLKVFTDSYTGELVMQNPIEGAWQVQLFDLTGKEVFKQQIEEGTMVYRMDRSALRKGIYLLRFTPAPGVEAATIKVMLP